VYCDFSIAVRPQVPVAEYLRALGQEWDTRHADSDLRLTSVYMGGGTPSKLGAEGVARLLDLIRDRADVGADAEVTLEANPEDVTRDSVRAWAAAGVNRVSLGVQTFDDAALVWMHRSHDAATARNAIHVLRESGIANLSIDLIFSLPASAESRSWKNDLDAALALDLPHLSVYGLTVEEHTPLGRWVARRSESEAPEETFESEFLAADTALASAGFEHYEVSNYGRPGQHSRHNWAYWRRSAYAGLGPSAHEFDGQSRRWNTPAYAHWVARLARGQDSVDGCEALAPAQRTAEEVYLGLRTSAGLALHPGERVSTEQWSSAGWANLGEDGVLRLTPTGWLRLDSIASALTMLRSRY
jgi:oxygen-independent coproporphyrinogen III oxidase